MTLRHRYFDVLDWLDRNRAPIAACAVVTTLAIGALFVVAVVLGAAVALIISWGLG